MNIELLLHDHYGFDRFQSKYLEGFENKTYRIIYRGSTYILKIYVHSRELESSIQAEDNALRRLEAIKSFSFPRVQKTVDDLSFLVQDGKLIRLLSFVEGELLGNIGRNKNTLDSLGAVLGKMDRCLFDLYEPALAVREDDWDLRYVHRNLRFLSYIDSPSDQNLVCYFLLQFDENVLPLAHKLRKGVIHNDANDWNIVTEKDKVCGIFDFGDLAYTWIINELAIGITYIMMNEEEPLNRGAEVIKAYHKEFPLAVEEIDVLYYLVAARLCTSVCNSAYKKHQKPDSEYITISEDDAWALLRKWKSINPLRAKQVFREAADFTGETHPVSSDLLKSRGTYLSKTLSLSYKTPIPMYGAAFQYMYDLQGNTFLDAYNNIMLAGHCHPHVVTTGQKMMARLNTNTRYLYDIIYEYSEKLLQKFPDPLNKIFLVNSGSEASDLAIRIARHHTGRKKIMVLEQGYHGNTTTGIEISHYKYASAHGVGKSDHIVETPMPKTYGSGYEDDGSSGQHFAKISEKRIAENPNEIAAFIAEPVMGCGGQVPLAKGYLKEVYPLIRKQGGVCISDEVQVGFGRLGSTFWGFELHDVIPDIVVLGKPMGNGHPIGAIVTTEAIASSFEEGPEFFSSFGGNPVSCAIGNAVLEVIEQEKLQQKALETGDHLMSRLRGLQKKYPVIGDIRGHGMFIGVELINPTNQKPETELSQWIKNSLRENHILIGTDGPYDNVLKIKPPLSFNKQNADTLVYTLEGILANRL